MKQPILFVGAGPGAPDLITVRGLAALRAADLIIYAGSLVNEQLLDAAPEHAELRNSAAMELDEVIAAMCAAHDAGRRVVRLHTGDPALYGAVAEQYRRLDKLNIPYEVIPGVSSVLAAAAALKTELTVPDVSQTVILTRAAGRTPVPPGEELSGLAAHGSTLCLFLSVDRLPELVAQLRAAGRPATTPVAVVYRASWPNEEIIRGTLGDIAELAGAAGIKRQAQIIVGAVLGDGGSLSRLYAGSFAHGYRGAAATATPKRCAVFALTSGGADKAAEIAAGLGEDTPVCIPEKYAARVAGVRRRTFAPGEFGAAFAAAFAEFDALVMVMAAGIAVRHLSGLCVDKRRDPAVLVADELGNNIISLLGGHQGGGNALARRVAGITGGQAVITTATDVRGLYAFDLLAQDCLWRIENPEALAPVTSALLDGAALELALPREIFDRHYAAVPNLVWRAPDADGAMTISDRAAGVTLILRPRRFTLGVGCHRDTPVEVLESAVDTALAAAGIDWTRIVKIGSAELKRDEAGLLELARRHAVELVFFSRDELNGQPVTTPSAAARKHFGINSVSEAAALLAAGENAALSLPRQVYTAVTVAVAEEV